ncbi:hypothetical protein BXZ70DRAFT_1011881 [Cristinia sonorae]|uniref:Uncharacterized protein n=1 Tax=Cristinia sonorae TaxID=1940300 RepID=A0A8K0XKW6_9AGAR|nr:hypothetical protein BXZ70DRAFT_1011881 [Cristinia sonorae]
MPLAPRTHSSNTLDAGLNLWIGEGDITGDFDWKHELKRMGRLMRTAEGMQIGKTIVNMEVFTRQLERVRDKEDVQILMNPADSQDVPRAIIFIHAVADVARLYEDAKSIASELYGDTQTTVKNALFCIAKQKELDPAMKFLLFKLEDYRLEQLFGLVREQGGHNPNFPFKGLIERLGASVDAVGAFSRLPRCDPGHRRLKVTRTEHADHLNVKSWDGDAVVGHVVMESSWDKGRVKASASIKKVQIDIDFDDANVDMLKPFGDGKYPGVSTKFVDRSLEPESVAPHPNLSPPLSAPLPCSIVDVVGGMGSVVTDLDTNDLDQSQLAEDAPGNVDDLFDIPHSSGESPTTYAATYPPLQDSHAAHSAEAVQSLADMPLALEDTLDTADWESDSIEASSPWITYQGKRIHKSTICRVVITPGYVRKSHERVLRVRGYTSGLGLKIAASLSSNSILDENAFVVGDLFASFIDSGSHGLCLAVFKSIVLEEKSRRVPRVQLQSLPFPTTGIRITGQILTLKHVPRQHIAYVNDDFSHGRHGSSERSSATTAHPAVESDAGSDHMWAWTGDFTKLSLDQSKPEPTGKAARRTITIKLPSHICQPLNPRIGVVNENVRRLFPNLQPSNISWVMESDELDMLTTTLWENIKTRDRNVLSIISKFGTNDDFPYKSADGHLSLMSKAGSAELESQAAKEVPSTQFRCFQCSIVIERKKARDHVAGDILRALRGVEDLKKDGISVEPVGASMPCGFCGRSGIDACSEVYLTKGKNPQAVSNCQYAVKYSYKSSLESTSTGPSTNTPIKCEIPNCAAVAANNMIPAIWKLNMPEHLRVRHPGFSLDGVTGAPVTPEFARSIHLSSVEEESPLEKIPSPSPLLSLLSSDATSPTLKLPQTRGRKRLATGAVSLSRPGPPRSNTHTPTLFLALLILSFPNLLTGPALNATINANDRDNTRPQNPQHTPHLSATPSSQAFFLATPSPKYLAPTLDETDRWRLGIAAWEQY